MNMTQLSLLAVDMSFGDRAMLAGQMILIGVGAVFGVLTILWGVLALFRRLLVARIGEDAPAEAPKPVAAPAPVAVATPAPSNDDAVIAAITAAVAATLAEENGGAVPAFRVVSYRRATTVSRHHK